MAYVLNEKFLPEKYFEDICRIPHGSYHEKPLSDYLVQFAQTLGLRCKQDDIGNVIIYKAASPGYEDHPSVMLQGHMDMVCEKEPGCTHDFEHDPLDIYVEDGVVRARGTTLGGDDGVGVAYMMSVLADDTVAHPPLECLFTVQEEVGCCGAASIDGNDFQAKQMIGLDNVTGDSTYICSAGMGILSLSKKLSFSPVSQQACRLEVSGLVGGHSGEQIHLEKGNAIKIAARALYELLRSGHLLRLVSIDGGAKINSIPRMCEAVFVCGDPAAAAQQIARTQEALRRELTDSDPQVTLTLSMTEAAQASSEEETKEVIEYLRLFPDGLRHRSLAIEGLTTASSNLGVLETKDGILSLGCSARGAEDSFFASLIDEVRILSGKYGWEETSYNETSCWPYLKNSRIRELAAQAYKEITGKELIELAVHGGLECGDISAAIPGIDIVTLGPLVEEYHTYREYMDLASLRETYQVLLTLLKKL